MPKDVGGLSDNLRAIAELNIKKGIRSIRNDVRGPGVARVDKALTLARSEKRGREFGLLTKVGENGVGLKAAAAKLGGAAVVLGVHPAQDAQQLRREDGSVEAVPAGSAVFTVGVLAESLQKPGRKGNEFPAARPKR